MYGSVPSTTSRSWMRPRSLSSKTEMPKSASLTTPVDGVIKMLLGLMSR